jgi:PhnB protein
MQLTPYLSFDGQCEAAFRFYERCLGARTAFMLPYPDAPGRILHATLKVGEQVLQGADAPPDQYGVPRGFAMSIVTESPAEALRLFSALSEAGTVRMPLQPTFWSPSFGMLTDQFGIPWMIGCDQPPETAAG